MSIIISCLFIVSEARGRNCYREIKVERGSDQGGFIFFMFLK